MGRYISGDFDYKFWFAVQPSSDITEFGGYNNTSPSWCWSEEDLPYIKEKLNELEKQFEKDFSISVDDFLGKIEKKGYLMSSGDEETKTEKWQLMSKAGAKIALGRKIKAQVEKQGDVYVDYEE